MFHPLTISSKFIEMAKQRNFAQAELLKDYISKSGFKAFLFFVICNVSMIAITCQWNYCFSVKLNENALRSFD